MCIRDSGISVLYVSPIKALLNNQEQRLHHYMQLVGRRAALWHGDTSQSEKRKIKTDQPDLFANDAGIFGGDAGLQED